MAATQIILLERVDSLGQMGDVVNVKPGFARNFLLPQGKALRASKENLAYFEGQRKALEAENKKKAAEAEKLAKKIEDAKVSLIRAASESGQLYGSVNARDIADAVSAQTGVDVARNMVVVNDNFKTIGLFAVDLALHAEVKVSVTVNIARSEDEAQIQAETGKALVADSDETLEEVQEEVTAEIAEEQLAEALEEDALEAEVARQSEEAEKEAVDAAKAEAKSEARAAKKAEKAVSEEVEVETEIGASTEAKADAVESAGAEEKAE